MKRTLISAALAPILISSVAVASSHREAPLITKYPKVDNTDVDRFNSYENGRTGYVTILANFQPFEDPFGGPNYYQMDEKALYSIHIDNDGDAREDISFHFRFFNTERNIAIPVGNKQVPVPLAYVAPFGDNPDQDNSSRNVFESFAVVTAKEQRNNPNAAPKIKLANNLTLGGSLFPKPYDNVGTKTIPNYEAYAKRHIQRIGIDGCASEGRVFVGQRREGFKIAVGEIFDLVNLNPLGPVDGEPNDLENKNITTIALEVPVSCLTSSSPIIGAWSTASLPTSTDYHGARTSSRLQQVSRLGSPLVNEVVIGLPDKDKFNTSHPRNDGQFATYVTNPTLPELIQTLFPAVTAPNAFPRTDLVAAFLTGIEGLNRPQTVTPSEMLRLNTSIQPKPAGAQSPLGVLGGDLSGFPNGRRPGDDVVDIALRVVMGVLLPESEAPSGRLPYTDGVAVRATDFRNTFPYLNTPIPGDADD